MSPRQFISFSPWVEAPSPSFASEVRSIVPFFLAFVVPRFRPCRERKGRSCLFFLQALPSSFSRLHLPLHPPAAFFPPVLSTSFLFLFFFFLIIVLSPFHRERMKVPPFRRFNRGPRYTAEFTLELSNVYTHVTYLRRPSFYLFVLFLVTNCPVIPRNIYRAKKSPRSFFVRIYIYLVTRKKFAYDP